MMTKPRGAATSAEVAGLLQLLRRAGADVECRVSGASMGPSVPDGSTVRIALDGGAAARPGDAVALLLGSETFSVHRLVRRGRSGRARSYVLTHGDANLFCDAPLREAELIGTVQAVRPDDAAPWQPVPAAARHGFARTALTGMFERTMGLALELSPAVAISIKNLLVLFLTPLMWLRPHQGRERSTSRLVAASQAPTR